MTNNRGTSTFVLNLAWMGARIAPDKNSANQALIHAADSKIAIALIPTNEEMMIATHALTCIATV